MQPRTNPNRRTVLKTSAAALLGAGVAGTTMARAGDDEHDDNSGGDNSGDDDHSGDGNSEKGHRGHGAVPRPDLEIVATHEHDGEYDGGEHGFTLSVAELPTGWRTLQFDNATSHTHFTYLSKVPKAAIEEAEANDNGVLEHYVERVTRPFQWLMDDIAPDKEPDPDDRFSEEQLFPDWITEVLPSGGNGLTSPGRVTTTTQHLDPGTYVLECYVKDANNDFHSYHGMLDLLTVTDDECGCSPDADAELTVSTDGIDAPDDLRPGRQTVGVTFADQTFYETNVGLDVHLVRLDEETTVEDVNGWMNWADPTQLRSDGNEPGTFIGGVETIVTPGLLDGSETETAYVHLDLTPGDYAWVAEVPDPASKGLLREFSVPFCDE